MTNFRETRQFLFQVKDAKRRFMLMRERGERTADDAELKTAIKALQDAISQLPDVNQQFVLTRRYIDDMSWEQIAAEMNTHVRVVQKFHGKALPEMAKVLGLE